MSISYEEVEAYLLQIFTGAKYVYICDKLLMFKHPSNDVKQRANLVYKHEYDRAVEFGMLPKEQLELVIEKRGLFTDDDKSKMKKLQDQIYAQEVVLSKTVKIKANQERILGVIRRLKSELFEIESKKSSALLLSAETKADEDRIFNVCTSCVYKETGELYWSSYDEALTEDDLEFKNTVLTQFILFYSGIDTATIRDIARHNLWRIRYTSSQKTSDSLFGVPTSDYTTDQLNLVYWSSFYQNIYEMLPEDRPSDNIIEDDVSLDSYIKAYYEERNREDAARRSQKTSSGNLSSFDREEVIVTRSHALYEDINYNIPKEAQRIKDRVDIKKRAKRG